MKNKKMPKNTVMGKNVRIGSNVTINDNVEIKDNAFIGNNVTLGEPLLGYYRDKRYKNPKTVIGVNSIIRSGSTIYAGTRTGRNFHTGHNVVIREYSEFGDFCVFGTFSQSDGYIKVGDYCRFHNNVFLAQRTTVGNYVWLSPFVVTLDSPHPPCRSYPLGPVIGDYTVVGARSIVLPRIKVGSKAVIACGSIVTHDVPGGMLVAGSPAKVIKKASAVRCRISRGRKPYPWSIADLKNKIY